ncbi:hypothetical protein [Streptomyces sp. NBC_00872]|uniref:hypothetical protein n=1 Tax=Streptomyces sp. NBC_00872 TaxID=2903686 RepID=UPI00386B4FCB|nr:hypothetical protein OG214_25955 [Streptomyces sp. NBC_00872]
MRLTRLTGLTVVVSETVVVPATVSGTVVSGTVVFEAVRHIRVALVHPDTGAPVVDEHLRVGLPAPGPWPLLADVLLSDGEGARGVTEPRTVRSRLAESAECHPGALVVGVRLGSVCRLRVGPGGTELTLRAPRAVSAPPWGVWASLAHTWLVAGLPWAELASATVRLLPPRSCQSPGDSSVRSSDRLSDCSSDCLSDRASDCSSDRTSDRTSGCAYGCSSDRAPGGGCSSSRPSAARTVCALPDSDRPAAE